MEGEAPSLKRSTQLKKWAASKLCESQGGRRLLLRLAGPLGLRLLDAVTSALRKHSPRQLADHITVHIYKVVSKIGVLVNEKAITDEMIQPCKQPNILLLHCIIKQLDSPVESRDADVLFSLVNDCFDSTFRLVSQFNGSAPDRLSKIREFVISTDIVSFFLSNSEAEQERDIVLNTIRILMSPYEAEVVQMGRVLKQQLNARRLELQRLLDKPTIQDFLKNIKTFTTVCDWFSVNKGSDWINWLYFYKSMKDYCGVTSRNLLRERALQIEQKYLLGPEQSTFPVSLPSEIQQILQDRIEREEFTHSIFAECAAYTTNILNDDFLKMCHEKTHFKFLRVELEYVESKLAALSKQEDAEGFVISKQSILLIDDDASNCSREWQSHSDGSVNTAERKSSWS